MQSDTPRCDDVYENGDVTSLSWHTLAFALERELTAATTELSDLRLRIAQLEGVGDMWRTAELALAAMTRERDGYAQQMQRLMYELRRATGGAQ